MKFILYMKLEKSSVYGEFHSDSVGTVKDIYEFSHSTF